MKAVLSLKTEVGSSWCVGATMAEVINLRAARKRAKRLEDDARANTNRLAHGQPKHVRKLETAQQKKAAMDLDQHRMDRGDDR